MATAGFECEFSDILLYCLGGDLPNRPQPEDKRVLFTITKKGETKPTYFVSLDNGRRVDPNLTEGMTNVYRYLLEIYSKPFDGEIDTVYFLPINFLLSIFKRISNDQESQNKLLQYFLLSPTYVIEQWALNSAIANFWSITQSYDFPVIYVKPIEKEIDKLVANPQVTYGIKPSDLPAFYKNQFENYVKGFDEIKQFFDKDYTPYSNTSEIELRDMLQRTDTALGEFTNPQFIHLVELLKLALAFPLRLYETVQDNYHNQMNVNQLGMKYFMQILSRKSFRNLFYPWIANHNIPLLRKLTNVIIAYFQICFTRGANETFNKGLFPWIASRPTYITDNYNYNEFSDAFVDKGYAPVTIIGEPPLWYMTNTLADSIELLYTLKNIVESIFFTPIKESDIQIVSEQNLFGQNIVQYFLIKNQEKILPQAKQEALLQFKTITASFNTDNLLDSQIKIIRNGISSDLLSPILCQPNDDPMGYYSRHSSQFSITAQEGWPVLELRYADSLFQSLAKVNTLTYDKFVEVCVSQFNLAQKDWK